MKRGKGIITPADLKKYRAVWREPVRFRYRGREVISMPPPSSGGLVLALTAALVEPHDLSAMGWHSAAHLHLMAEAFRRGYAERNVRLGDPDFEKLPVGPMLAPAHVAKLAKSIDPARATPSTSVQPGPIEGENTTHYAVVDGAGNVVAVTYTLNALYGSAVTVAGAGFLLNDEMDDFTTVLGEPNSFGLVQGQPNQIVPGKRMLSSMAPTIVVGTDGKPEVVVGARGGSRIITALWQVISNVVDFGMDGDAAVRAPRMHHQHLPDTLALEQGGFADGVRRALAAMGHTVKESPLPAAPVASAPALVRRGGTWTAVADPRRGGAGAAR
jgi:gamma-glutamyltranspeptidase/glutathione hydrolase